MHDQESSSQRGKSQYLRSGNANRLIWWLSSEQATWKLYFLERNKRLQVVVYASLSDRFNINTDFYYFYFRGKTLKTFKLSYITEEVKYNSKTLKDRDSVHICQAEGIISYLQRRICSV